MNKENWAIDEYGYQIFSKRDIEIPWLQKSVSGWFEMEDDESWWTESQMRALENFLNLPGSTRKSLELEINELYSEEIKSGRITNSENPKGLSSINWGKSHLCIPHHYKSKEDFILLLPESKSLLLDGEFPFEMEFLFVNGKLKVAQEFNGIHTGNVVEGYSEKQKLSTTKPKQH